jgi:RNA polymerase sigma-70 factor (ECF subfamily)
VRQEDHDILKDLDDAALLARAAAADERAFATLVARHRPRLLAWARRVGGDQALAEDAVQEALTAAWRHAAGYRGETPVRGWLATLVRHALWRALDRRARVQLEPPEDLEALGARAGWGDPELGARIESVVASRECLEHAFGALPTHDREVLALVDIEGASLEEASTTLELGLAALKSRLHRARLRLVASLRQEGCDGR